MLSAAPIRAYIPAANLARARKFYEETVGLKPGEAYAGGVIYRCGGAEVFMYQTGNAGTSKASQVRTTRSTGSAGKNDQLPRMFFLPRVPCAPRGSCSG